MTKVRRTMSIVGVVALTMTAPVLLSVASAGAATKSKTVTMDGYRCSIVSTRAHATLHGRAGEVLCGLGRNSTLYAGSGYEVLIAGAGRDTLVASPSPSSVDVLIGGWGNDTLIGGGGADTLIGGSGTNVLRGGWGTQSLYAGSRTNLLLGGTGATTLTGGPGFDTLRAGRGRTTLLGGAGYQRLFGGAGHDIYIGGSGRTTIHAGTGSRDLLLSASHTTSLDCGSAAFSFVVKDRLNTQNGDCTRNGNRDAGYQFYEGTVTGVSGTQATVTYTETNDAAKAWLAANSITTSVTIDLTGATVTSDTGSIVPSLNDCISALASTPAAGITLLPAVFVELHTCESSDTGLQRYRGTVTSINSAGTIIGVTWTHANDTAQAWLASNGNPNPVSVDISSATISSHTGSTTPAVNDCVSVSANAPTTPGGPLIGVRVRIHHCEGEDGGLLDFRGTVTGTTGSPMTVTYTDANDAAQAWLNSMSNPTTVTFDISSATIMSDTGSNVPMPGDCVEASAPAPTTSSTTLVAVQIELFKCGQFGGDEDHSLQRYRGTVTSVDATGKIIGVTWTDANGAARAWLRGNGDPNPVSFDITSATVETTTGSTTPVAGDCIGISANPPTTPGAPLPAVAVVLHTCDQPDNAYLLYGGTVTSYDPGTSTLQLHFMFDNPMAQAWQSANGNLNPATFDLTSAKIDSHTGSSAPAANDCAAIAATPPAPGITTLPAVQVELFSCGAGPGE